jgi:Kef-type K+ transport system membrane component KefB
MVRNVAFYVVTIGLCLAAVIGLLELGSGLPPGAEPPVAPAKPSTSAARPADGEAPALTHLLHENLRHPVSVLLIQVIVIVVAARLAGALFHRIGQPPVIGEMVAGILLGPSLLGLLWPEAQAFLFPPSSMPALSLFSQVGVILFMFVVGIDLDASHLQHKAGATLLVSHASITVPFLLGTAFCLLIYRQLAPAGVSFTAFALFIAIAMSITAFPVLARIIEERGMSRSYLGVTAIACAAVGDVSAWCLLALVIAVVTATGFGAAALTIGLSLLFVGLMLFVVRPRLARFAGSEFRGEAASKGLVAGIMIFAFASALFTEVIGIHALFGAFLAGAVMPYNLRLRTFLKERLETFTTVLLLPLFFVFTGLRTQVGLLNDWEGWLMCAGVIAVAIAGKLGGSMLAARWTGIGWRDAFAIGALMNTRGLMELIVLNIGYDLGILSPRVFAMMVLMALVTTFMAGPLLALRNLGARRNEDQQSVAASA